MSIKCLDYTYKLTSSCSWPYFFIKKCRAPLCEDPKQLPMLSMPESGPDRQSVVQTIANRPVEKRVCWRENTPRKPGFIGNLRSLLLYQLTRRTKAEVYCPHAFTIWQQPMLKAFRASRARRTPNNKDITTQM